MQDVEPQVDPTKRVEVGAEEMALAFAVPAMAVNKFTISINATGVRIAFGESIPLVGDKLVGDAVRFSSAVTLTPLDAIALHRVLRGLLADWEVEFVNSGYIGRE